MKRKRSIKNALKNIIRELKRIIKREINYYRVKPTHALLFLTYRCTCRCISCSMWKREETIDPKEEMSLMDWKRCIDMISERGIEDIELFGGDALLRKDVLVPLIKYIHSKGIHTNLPTNGNLLDREMAFELVNSGLDDIYISIDAIGELHDRMRGVKGTFDRAKKGIQYLIEARGNKKTPEIICNCTISSLNVEHFEEVITFTKESGMDSVHLEYVGEIDEESIKNSEINGVIPEPYYIPQKNSLYLNKEQAIFLKEKLAKIREISKMTGIWITSKNIDMLTIDNLINGVFSNKRCYICRYLIAVDPFGNIMPCPFFNNYTIGNIKNEDLCSIWDNRSHQDFMKLQAQKKIAICTRCILGVQRNPTFYQSLVKLYYVFMKKEKV